MRFGCTATICVDAVVEFEEFLEFIAQAKKVNCIAQRGAALHKNASPIAISCCTVDILRPSRR